MNTYIDYLKTLNIDKGYNYVCFDDSYILWGFVEEPKLEMDNGYYGWASNNKCDIIGRIPKDIAIDIWQDSVIDLRLI